MCVLLKENKTSFCASNLLNELTLLPTTKFASEFARGFTLAPLVSIINCEHRAQAAGGQFSYNRVVDASTTSCSGFAAGFSRKEAELERKISIQQGRNSGKISSLSQVLRFPFSDWTNDVSTSEISLFAFSLTDISQNLIFIRQNLNKLGYQ